MNNLARQARRRLVLQGGHRRGAFWWDMALLGIAGLARYDADWQGLAGNDAVRKGKAMQARQRNVRSGVDWRGSSRYCRCG